MPPPDASGGAKRLAVLGARRWGRKCIRTVQTLPGVRLTALYSTNPDSRSLVEDAVVIADDWRRLIDDFDGDGVIVTTPPEHHAEMVERAAKRGLAVMVEKPLTLDLDEAIRLARSVADADVALLVDHVHLFNPAYRKLKEMAAGLGPCYVVGAGDTVEPAPELADAHAVLINPGVALATGDVFAALDESPEPASGVARLVPPVSGIGDLVGQLLARGNDLERIATVLVPEIRVALQALSELPGCLLARMSGSGATCYGLFAQAAEAAAGAAFLRHAYDDWWVRETAFRRVGAQEPDGAAS